MGGWAFTTAFVSVGLLALSVGLVFGSVSGGVLVDWSDGAGGAVAATAFAGVVVACAGGMLAGCCMSLDACSLSLSRSTTRGVELALAAAFAAAFAGAFAGAIAGAFAGAAVASCLHEGSAFSALHVVVPSDFKAGFSCFTGVEAMG